MSTPDNTTLRILDANLNRAREALRVLEEYARFGLDDAGLTREAKKLRHALAASVPRGIAPLLTSGRDIVGDVGRGTSVSSAFTRAGLGEVIRAAAARLSEALRSLEEYGKIVDGHFATCVERLRYEGYELERRMDRLLSARARLRDVRLCVIVTESLCAGDWLATARAAIDGGADCLQLREKAVPDRALLTRVKRLADLCHERGTMLIVNDRVDIGVLAGADGVHLGQGDLSVWLARRLAPPGFVIGSSTHTAEEAAAAAAEAPDYIAAGPVFPSETKPGLNPAGPPLLVEARGHTSIPLMAVGGIHEGNAAEVLQAVPDCMICVCRAVIGTADACGATARLRTVIDRIREGRSI